MQSLFIILLAKKLLSGYNVIVYKAPRGHGVIMWYYLKQCLISFGYMLFLTMGANFVALMGGQDGQNLIWLKWIFSIIMVVSYILLVSICYYKEGEGDYKKLLANDLERKRIVETGDFIEINEREEYKPWKGFLYGAITCAPLIILLILHTIIGLASGGENLNAGALAGYIYLPFFIFFHMDINVDLVFADYYLALFAVPIIVLSTGIPYIMGTFKAKKTQAIVEQRRKEIYGK